MEEAALLGPRRAIASNARMAKVDIAAEVLALRAELAKAGSPARAGAAAAYLKSELRFLGAPMPAIRKAALGVCRRAAKDRATSVALARALWETDVHELRAVGIAVLEKRRALLVAGDLTLVEWMLRRAQTWAYVDWLAMHVAGDLIARFPGKKTTLRRWAKDDGMWVRRAALLALLVPLRRGEGDFALFTKLAVPMLRETDFFIRKAIGWVLREVSKKRPELTRAFLAEHEEAMGGVTRREAGRLLPLQRPRRHG